VSRTTRVARAATLSVTPIDVATIEDLYALGVATTPIALLLRRSHAPAIVGGMANHRRRLTALFHEGYLSRFEDRFGILLGSRSFIYAVESGVAAGAAATRKHYDDIDGATWSAIRASAEPLRERLIELLVARGHAATEARPHLEQLTTLCLRYYCGETTLRHKLLASAAAAILWFGARTRGIRVHTVRADGALAIAVARADGGTVSIRPDLFFGLGDTAVFLEAETGTASRAKVASKLAQYASLVAGDVTSTLKLRTDVVFRDARLLIHCATAQHAAAVASLASTQPVALRRILRITGPADLSTDLAVVDAPDGGDDVDEYPLAASDIVGNGALPNGVRVFDYFRARIASPVFAAVSGRDATGPILHCTPFLEGLSS
jgi:Replication-relaxation